MDETTTESSTDSDGTDDGSANTDESSDTESTESDTPGFGALVAVVALLAAALLARYRR